MDIKNLCVNTIRILSVEAIDKANSGHPGLPLGAAPMAFTLFSDIMNFNPKNSNWINRDRFILSAGHGSALLYSLLHIFGYSLTIEDLKEFRQKGSLTPGHPEYGHTEGVEATTGPLGQGVAMGVGLAMAQMHMGELFNTEDFKVFDNYTYVLTGDGCLMEGISNEASSLAGTLELSKLIMLYDSNNITIEGNTDVAFKENVRARYEALGWDTFSVEDGNDLEEIRKTIEKAKLTNKPSLIEIKTKIGYGSVVEGSEKAHGSPLKSENTKKLKEKLNWCYSDKFYVPNEVYQYVDEVLKEKEKVEKKWNKQFEEYKIKHKDLYLKLQSFLNMEKPVELLNSDILYNFSEDISTREASGKILNKISKKMSNLFGGSADLAPSNKCVMENFEYFSHNTKFGANIHFGVREHAMAAIANGLFLYGGIKPFISTFFVFSDYLKPALRLSALMKLGVIYILTHDSIGVGEDGPTHEPIEQLAMIRSIPDVVVFRPCDWKETAAAWSYAINNDKHPTVMVLSRQKLKNIENTGRRALKGAYILKDSRNGNPELIIIATGSEVGIALEAADILEKEGRKIRVVSMPSMELFEMQSEEYKNKILPDSIRKRISVEALSDFGWYKYIGLDGKSIGMKSFGISAPGKEIFKTFDITTERIVKESNNLLNKE